MTTAPVAGRLSWRSVVEDLSGKIMRVRSLLKEAAPLLVAFSGGVDSTLLLKLALDEVDAEGVVAATAHGDVHTAEELEAARAAAARLGSGSWWCIPTNWPSPALRPTRRSVVSFAEARCMPCWWNSPAGRDGYGGRWGQP